MAAGLEGITPEADEALARFERAVVSAYGERLKDFVVFGSRARGEARRESDVDVAVVLEGPIRSRFAERMLLADLAYDAIVATGVHVQPWPITADHWRDPEGHSNPALVRAMRRDGKRYERGHVSGPVLESD